MSLQLRRPLRWLVSQSISQLQLLKTAMPDPEIIPPEKPRRGKPKRRYSPPIDETPEQRKQREAFQRVVEIGRIEYDDDLREPNDMERGLVRSMVFAGITQEKISACLGISISTLVRNFRRELDNGKEMLVAEIAYTLAARARAGSDVAAIYLLKVRGGPAFSEARANKDATGSADFDDGSPEQITREEKDRIIGKVMELVNKASEPVLAPAEETK